MLELKTLRKLKKEPYSEYVKVNHLTQTDIEKMYNIYSHYYANTDFDLFKRDLMEKTGVFIIREPKKDFLVGFSTIVERDFHVNGKTAHGFFSGDTIIEEAYWGSRALQRAMFRYVLSFKLRHTGKPIYWLLISKGFKTYLLLANNYTHYYPNPENKDDHLKEYVLSYCREYFGEYYDENKQLLNFGDDYQALKPDVAPITVEMRQKSPKIAFFEDCNPTWQKGTELPCIGELRWVDVMESAILFLKKTLIKDRSKTKKASTQAPAAPQTVTDTDHKDDSKVA